METNSDERKIEPFCKEVKQTAKLLVDRRMMLLLPQVFWTGMSLAVFTGLLIPMIAESIPGDDNQDKFQKSMFCMATFGVGEMMGSLIIGFIIDKVGNKAATLANITMIFA